MNSKKDKIESGFNKLVKHKEYFTNDDLTHLGWYTDKSTSYDHRIIGGLLYNNCEKTTFGDLIRKQKLKEGDLPYSNRKVIFYLKKEIQIALNRDQRIDEILKD